MQVVLKYVTVPSFDPLACFPYQEEKQTAESVAEMICNVMRRVVVREGPSAKKNVFCEVDNSQMLLVMFN